MESKYYVTSNGDSPDRIYFNLVEAMRDESQFIDVFDSNGIWVRAYEWDNEEQEYVQFFILGG